MLAKHINGFIMVIYILYTLLHKQQIILFLPPASLRKPKHASLMDKLCRILSNMSPESGETPTGCGLPLSPERSTQTLHLCH